MPDLVPDEIDDGGAYAHVRADIVALLEVARRDAARSVNALMTASYWAIGQRIVAFEQDGRHRAMYGDALIERLAHDLTHRFGRGFSRQNIWQMRAFLPGQARRSDSPDTVWRIFGPEGPGPGVSPAVVSVRASAVGQVGGGPGVLRGRGAALRCGWSVRQLDRQVNSQFYERIALSRNKAAMLEKAETPDAGDAVTPEQAIKDPFVLEFLNLKDEYSESDLEDGLIQHLADFLLELGDDFAFVGR